MKQPILALILPCYNEEEVLPTTIRRLVSVVDELVLKEKISKESFILFVDDGSKDETWKLIESFSKNNIQIKGLKLSRNQGHQNALMAGIEYVVNKCDCLISMDADLQDDVQAIFSMIDKFESGNEIVYGVRSKRETDSFFKKFTAEGFYKLMKTFGVDIVFNHADYRLMSQKAVRFFLKFEERNLFIRGIIPMIGLKSDVVYYERNERFVGESKYPIKKMLSFALDGITSFSVTPLRLISILGFLIFLGSIVMSIYILVIVFFTNNTIPGWASVILPIYFLGGVQMLSLGIVGEYIGKIYKEIKRRPRYFVEKETSNE